MKCRNCSAEIAEKAIVCYRCGTPTADLVEVPRHAPPRARGRFLLIIVLVVVVLAIALYVVFSGRPVTTDPPTGQRGLATRQDADPRSIGGRMTAASERQSI